MHGVKDESRNDGGVTPLTLGGSPLLSPPPPVISSTTIATWTVLRVVMTNVMTGAGGIWPARLPRLGMRVVTDFTPCHDCETDPPADEILAVGELRIPVPGARGTFVAFGGVALCRRHARGRAGDAR